MGVGGGINDDAVHFAVSLLDLLHNGPLIVGLEQLHLHPKFRRGGADEVLQRGKILPAIDVGLPDPQQIQIGSVDHK